LRYEWSIELFDALAFMHEKSVSHRDLKPCNIYLFKNKRKNDQISLKLGDFGQSKVKSHSDMKTHVGTYYYQSPEIMNHKRYSNKTDVWYKFRLNFVSCYRDTNRAIRNVSN
jgi:serine/threonine protein kinase